MTVPREAVDDVPAAFTTTVRTAFASRVGPRFSLVLSGGPTARACYAHLAAAETAESEIDWSAVDVYMGDERWVRADDVDANQRLVRESLLEVVGPVGSFTPMATEGSVDACVAAYQEVIRQLIAREGIDLIHLGMGPDGHTASLFPGDSSLTLGPDTLVAATQDPNGRNPHPRLTLTLGAINAARAAVFTVVGPAKLDAVTQLRAGADLPASLVNPSQVIWLVDGPAFGDHP